MIKDAARSARPKNRLIDGLPRKDRLGLLALCEPSDLALAEVLCEPGKTLRYAYFPTSSFVSLISLIDGSASVEVGMVGNEGGSLLPIFAGSSLAVSFYKSRSTTTSTR